MPYKRASHGSQHVVQTPRQDYGIDRRQSTAAARV